MWDHSAMLEGGVDLELFGDVEALGATVHALGGDVGDDGDAGKGENFSFADARDLFEGWVAAGELEEGGGGGFVEWDEPGRGECAGLYLPAVGAVYTVCG